MWHLRCFTSAVLLLKNSHFCDILFVRASKKKAKSSKHQKKKKKESNKKKKRKSKGGKKDKKSSESYLALIHVSFRFRCFEISPCEE